MGEFFSFNNAIKRSYDDELNEAQLGDYHGEKEEGIIARTGEGERK